MATQQDQNPGDSILLQAFLGLKNVVNRERLGPQDLAQAVNIDIDDVGQPRMRAGYRKRHNGAFHSLYSAPWEHPIITLGVHDGNLVQINDDYSLRLIQTGAGSAPVCYVQVGDLVYYTGDNISGKINMLTGERSDWGGPDRWLSPVINPTATLNPIRGKLLGKPPSATSMAYFNGRIYMAQGNVLWATELYLYEYVDKTKTFIQFEHDITLLAPVIDGIFIGTTAALYFLSGTFGKMRRQDIQKEGVLPGSAVFVPTDKVDQQISNANTSKYAVLFMTAAGACVGFAGGGIHNLTQDRVEFPDAASAASLYRHEDGVARYIAVLDHRGDPRNHARFGDYVDAEIRRFGT